MPSAGAEGALKQDAGPPRRVSAVVFGHRWALHLRPCPLPEGAPGTGPGACRSVGEGLLPRATAQLQAARGNVRHKVFEAAPIWLRLRLRAGWGFFCNDCLFIYLFIYLFIFMGSGGGVSSPRGVWV